ncbi:MAG TPA: hypothetical protein VFG31_06850 [Conexibacter sp.]|nr:hypothetical protein [Conexibacter sp.]
MALLAVPASAWANPTDIRIIEDCQSSPTGALRGTYRQQQLNHALHHLPGDVREYSGCSDAIRQALLAGAGSGGGGGNDGSNAGGGGDGTSGGGANSGGFGSTDGAGSTGASDGPADTPPPPGAEQPVKVARVTIAPGSLPQIGKDAHRLPTGVVVLLVLLGIGALVPAAMTIGRRVVGHRGA